MADMKNLKEALAFGLKVGELIEGIANGLDAGDLGKAIEAATLAGPAIADIALIADEATDLDAAEKDELKMYVEQNFDLADDKVESAIEMGLKVAIDLSDLLKLIKK